MTSSVVTGQLASLALADLLCYLGMVHVLALSGQQILRFENQVRSTEVQGVSMTSSGVTRKLASLALACV